MNAFWFRKCVLVGVLLPIATSSLFAQSKTYTLQQLVDSAKNHYPQLLRKDALVNYSKAAVTDIRHSFLPAIRIDEQLTMGTDNSLAGSYFPFGIVPSTSAGIRAENNAQPATGNIAVLYGQYDLITFGYKKALIKRAGAEVDLLLADANQEQYYLKSELARWYFILLKNEYKLKADQENVTRYEKIFSVIQALTNSGIRAGSDSSLAMAELSRTKITLNQTAGTVQNCRMQISYFTGIPLENIHIDSSALRDLKIQSGAFNQRTDSAGNPLIDYYQRLKSIALANEQLISKSFLPRIILTASTWVRGSGIAYNDQYKSIGYGLGYQRYNYLAGISAQYDLFNSIHKHDRLNTARFATTASDFALQAQQLSLANGSMQADNAIQTTERNLLELPVQLTAAQDTYGQKIAQYKAGIINLVDLTNAAYVLYRSVNDYVETLGDWYLAQLDKAIATGNLDSFIRAIK